MPENKFWKCKAVSTSNIASLSGSPVTIDGVSLSSAGPDEVLLVGQTDPKQNGVYAVQTLAWTRTFVNAPAAGDYPGLHVVITEGTKFANTLWQITPAAVTLGTTDIRIEQVAAGVHATETGMLAAAGAPARKGVFGQAYDTQLQTVRVAAKDGVGNSVARWKKALTSELSTADTTATLNVIKDEIPSTEGRTVFLSRSVGFTGSTFTVPANVKLQFIDGGKIFIDANQTLTIEGDVEAGLFQIFEYASATTSKVEFGATQRPRRVHPEWWGAKGDGTTNDRASIQRMFQVGSSAGQELCAHFTSGRTYKVDSSGGTIKIGNGVIIPDSWIIEGYGATIKAVAAASTPVFTLGFYTATPVPILQQVLKLRWQGLSVVNEVTSPPYPTDSAAIALDYAQFCSFRDCTIGGFHYGIVARNQGGNSNSFENVNVAGTVVGVSFGALLASNGAFNVWRWVGGRIQQATSIGMHVYRGVNGQIENVDFSDCDATALKIEKSSGCYVRMYSEQIGPQTYPNTEKVVWLLEAKHVTVEGSLINGTMLPETGVYNKNAGYGVYLDACDHVRLTNNYFKGPQIADIFVASSCGPSIYIDGTNEMEPVRAAETRRVPTVSDATAGGVRLTQSRVDLPNQSYDAASVGQAINLVPSPCDFTHASWVFPPGTGGAVVAGTTMLAPDGVSQAQVITLPNAATTPGGTISTMTLTVDFGSSVIGKDCVLRFWWKPNGIANQATSLGDRGVHLLRVLFFRAQGGSFSTVDHDGAYDGTGEWQFVEQSLLGEIIIVCAAYNAADVVRQQQRLRRKYAIW